jgi:hypothetical protein
MQKRVMISGIPHWIGIYDYDPGECCAVGEVRGYTILVAASNQKTAVQDWVAEAETLLSSDR